ncbi:MAG TPA: FdrA family protein [Bacteroidales bacterium]|nr:FdrA family protein [Bacteroidales bacterium]
MIVKGFVKKGAYHDSVTLMLVTKEVNQSSGVENSGVVMASENNKELLRDAGLFLKEFESLTETDLIVSVCAKDEDDATKAIQLAEAILKGVKSSALRENVGFKSLSQAVSALPGANLAVISVAGRYAAFEAFKALENNLHVMLFSDNVSVEDEIRLKTMALEKGLLVMGPDCGTAIINGIPLAFANVVQRGSIGIVAASGTGLQEVSSIISNLGGGISQAIGTGGRDIKKEVGGLMFLEAIQALEQDPDTSIIVLISKPPSSDILEKIAHTVQNSTKPIVAILIGGKPQVIEDSGAYAATNLEEAAHIALALHSGENVAQRLSKLQERNLALIEKAKELALGAKGWYIRGLYSGGTLCDEAQLIAKDLLGSVYSNTPLNPKFLLKNANQSFEHTIVDLGDDEFTKGKPHPMIDFSLRNQRILSEASDKEVAVLLFDVVLGYGSHPDPIGQLQPAITEARKQNPHLLMICSVCGTNGDPQNKQEVVRRLTELGVEVQPSNAAASFLAFHVVLNLNSTLNR